MKKLAPTCLKTDVQVEGQTYEKPCGTELTDAKIVLLLVRDIKKCQNLLHVKFFLCT